MPSWLNEDNAKRVILGLKSKFQVQPREFYTFSKKLDPHFLYQGDCIKGVNIFFPDINKHILSDVMLISNTCDMDLTNERILPLNILVAPLVKIKKYKEILIDNGFTQERVDAHTENQKSQLTSHIIYLPGYSRSKFDDSPIEESFLFLDKTFSIPYGYDRQAELLEKRHFTLSDFGFYFFLVKISYHFTRMQDNVERGFD